MPPEAAERLRAEYARVRALHQRSVKLAAAARWLNLAVGTVGLMVKRGELDGRSRDRHQHARFVTRASVEAWRVARADDAPKRRPEQATVPLADVVRFTGQSQIELLDLVRAGVLEQAPGAVRASDRGQALRAPG